MASSILFFGKKGDHYCTLAADFIRQHFCETQIHMGEKGMPFPEDAFEWQGNYIISYLSPWIIHEKILNRADSASINFHPGNTYYPGIGCTNFAIYDQSDVFGVTCHHMAPKVDTGPVIVEKNFRVFPDDTVFSLTQRCYAHIFSLFFDIISDILMGRELPRSEAEWKRQPYTRKELNDLCRLTLSMSAEEMERRIRAVTFPGAPGAYLLLNGRRYELRLEGDNNE